MKKTILILLALMLTLSITACGGNDNNTPSSGNNTTAPPSQTESGTFSPTESAPETTTPVASESDEGTVAGFLAHYGLTEDDIKPEHFIEFGELDMDGNIKAGNVGSTGFIEIIVDKDATGEEEIKAWFEKIHDVMKKSSADGKLYVSSVNEQKEVSLESLFAGSSWSEYPGTMWWYTYKMPDKTVTLNISTSYSIANGIYKMSIGVFGG